MTIDVHPPVPIDPASGWQAHLSLEFASQGARTVLARRSHVGPLIVQKPLYPEGPQICHAVLIHAPGGIAGGDQLHLTTHLATGSRVLLTTPAATKWYKANGRPAQQRNRFELADDAILESLPQENILFNQGDARLETEVRLTGAAIFAGWEVVCLGRQAAGEHFESGSFRQKLEIFRDDRQIWGDYGFLAADDRLRASPLGLQGRPVFGSLAVAAGPVDPARLEACRAVTLADDGGRCIFGVTALPEVVSARYLGDNALEARHYFEQLWAILRPGYSDCPARRPRVWDN